MDETSVPAVDMFKQIGKFLLEKMTSLRGLI